MQTIEHTTIVSAEDKNLLGRIKQVVQRILPEAIIFLYGSVARGAAGPESDYDIYVLTARQLKAKEEEEIWSAVFDIEMARGAVISVQFCATEEWEQFQDMPFHLEIRRDGIIV